MQLRKILEEFIPEKAQKLGMWFNDNEQILKIASMKRLIIHENNDKPLTLGATKNLLTSICKLNKFELNEIQKEAPKGFKSNLKSINLLNNSLICFELSRIINTLNNASHHTNKKQESLRYKANEVLMFMLDKNKLSKIIEALR